MSTVGADATAAELKARFLHACAQTFDQFISPTGDLGGESFSDIEGRAEAQGRTLAGLLCTHRLAADPHSDPTRRFTCPHCAHPMRLQQRAQARTLASSVGDIALQRPYCVCDHCGFCCAPLDYALAIPAQGPSVGRRELVCHAATKDRSFEKAVESLEHYRHIHLSAEAIRQLAEGEGRHVRAARAQRVQRCFAAAAAVPPRPPRPATLMVVVADGGSVQTRDPAERWKNDKIGCVYDAVPEPDPRAAAATQYAGATAQTKTYVATMAPWEELGRLLFAEAWQRGYAYARTKLFLADGATAIASVHQEHFADAQFICDWYHAAGHLHDCARAAFEPGTAAAHQWAEEMLTRLWHGHRRLEEGTTR